jgi:hypothetical protein
MPLVAHGQPVEILTSLEYVVPLHQLPHPTQPVLQAKYVSIKDNVMAMEILSLMDQELLISGVVYLSNVMLDKHQRLVSAVLHHRHHA